MKIIEKRKCEITIRRPDGRIETVVHPTIDKMMPQVWPQVISATRGAGRGDCLSYRNIDAVVEMEEADYKGHCTRCAERIDARTAYRRGVAYYCEGCRHLLTAIGAGERTAMDG